MALSGRPKKVDTRIDNLRDNIRSRDFKTARETLKEFGINVQDGEGRTALINCVIEKQNEFLNWLLETGADVNVQDRGGWTALHFAAQNRLVQIAKILIDNKANLELRDRYGNTPLWTAVMNGKEDLAVVKLLLRHAANPANINNAGRSPQQMIDTIYGDSFKTLIDATIV